MRRIRTHDIEKLKAEKLQAGRKPKGVNNMLICLSKILHYAHEAGVIASVPKIKLLRLEPPKFDFFTFEELDQLLEAAGNDVTRRVLFLLGADAGLRQGEIIGLEWDDIDFVAGKLMVRRSVWRGHVTSPHGGRERTLPLTTRLAKALKAGRHLKGSRIFYREDGTVLTQSTLVSLFRNACKRAGLRVIRSHVLRHTFCFAPRHAGSSSEGDSGARGTYDADDDHAVHAFGTGGGAFRDSAFGSWAPGGQRRDGALVKLLDSLGNR